MNQRFINSVRVLLAVVFMVVACSTELHAQEPVVSGSLSRDSVEVGDHFDYNIDVEVDIATRWVAPTYGKLLTAEEEQKLAAAKQRISTLSVSMG